jgi:hypothetical protein
MSLAVFRDGFRASAAAMFFSPAGAVATGRAGAAFPAGGFRFSVAIRCPSYSFDEMADRMWVCKSRVPARGTFTAWTVTPGASGRHDFQL